MKGRRTMILRPSQIYDRIQSKEDIFAIDLYAYLYHHKGPFLFNHANIRNIRYDAEFEICSFRTKCDDVKYTDIYVFGNLDIVNCDGYTVAVSKKKEIDFLVVLLDTYLVPIHEHEVKTDVIIDKRLALKKIQKKFVYYCSRQDD